MSYTLQELRKFNHTLNEDLTRDELLNKIRYLELAIEEIPDEEICQICNTYFGFDVCNICASLYQHLECAYCCKTLLFYDYEFPNFVKYDEDIVCIECQHGDNNSGSIIELVDIEKEHPDLKITYKEKTGIRKDTSDIFSLTNDDCNFVIFGADLKPYYQACQKVWANNEGNNYDIKYKLELGNDIVSVYDSNIKSSKFKAKLSQFFQIENRFFIPEKVFYIEMEMNVRNSGYASIVAIYFYSEYETYEDLIKCILTAVLSMKHNKVPRDIRWLILKKFVN